MCDKCHKIDPCGCEEPKFCGCDTKHDFACIYYAGPTLQTLGITEGMDGKVILTKINNYLRDIISNLEISPTVIENVGDGIKIHKGISDQLIDELRSLKGIEGILIAEGEDVINIKVDATWLETQITQVIQDNVTTTTIATRYSSIELNPGTPETAPENWTVEPTATNVWMAIQEVYNGQVLPWRIIKTKGEPGKDGQKGQDGQDGVGSNGQSTLTSNIFMRSEIQPETPVGGSYLLPVPTGWGDGIPAENGNPAWMSTRIFTSDGLAPQQATWSNPVVVADSSTLDYEFSAFTGTSPGTPTQPLNGATWHNEGQPNDVWMAFRNVRNGVFGVWSVVRIKGEDGASGTGYTVVSHNPMESLAVGSDGVASIEKDFFVQIDVFMNATQLTATSNAILQANQYKINLPVSPLPGITIAKSGHNALRFRVAAGTVFPRDSVLTEIEVVAGLGQTALKSSFVIAPVWTAEDAQVLTLTSDANVIKQTPTGYIPSTVTLRAVKNNYNEVVSWYSEPISVLVTTGDTVIISAEDLFPGIDDSVKINISTPNGLSDSTTIVRVRDGDPGDPGDPGTAGSGYSVVSSNPMQAIAVGSDNTTSSQQSYLVSLNVYKNSTALQATTATTLTDSEFRVEVPASPKAGVTVARENAQTLRYTVANGIVFTDESVTSLIDITVGSESTVMKSSFVIVPIKTAEDAVSLNLNVDSNIVKFDAFNNLVTPTTITAMAVQQNSSETITWSSDPAGIVSGTGTLKSINTSGMFGPGVNSVKIRIDAGDMYDETTIVRVQDGAPGQGGEDGAQGITGTTGPSPRLMELVIGAQYENGQDFIDYAYYRSNDANEGWYTVKVVNGVRTVITYTGGVPDTSPTGPWIKSLFTKEMSFGTVIAEQANLAGFKFRNGNLTSQHDTMTAPCHVNPNYANKPLPNLSLSGPEATIKFLDRMIMDVSGLTLKDDCGRPRMIFKWENGLPLLRFLNETGGITWEAGQNGYVYITTGTIPSRWEQTKLVKLNSLNSYSPTSPITEFNTDIGSEMLRLDIYNSMTDRESIYNVDRLSCFGQPITTSTPYFLIYDMNAFSGVAGTESYVAYQFIKGDMAQDIDKYPALYLSSSNAVNVADVPTAPTGTFPPNGWYMIQGLSGQERDNNNVCNANKGVYPLFETEITSPESNVVNGYAVVGIAYLENGNIVKTIDMIEQQQWNR